MSFFECLKTRAQDLKKNRLKIALLGILILVAMLVPELTHAAEESASELTTDIEAKITAIVNVAFKFLNLLLYPLLIVISSLMDNEVLIGPDMEGKLLRIWVTIRNWVNIAFVLVLVIIALYNVLGISGEGNNYALKSVLPKIVIGLVAVNFSFLAGKVLIDSTAVLTEAVYALPTNLEIWDDEKEDVQKRLCNHIDETTETIEEKQPDGSTVTKTVPYVEVTLKREIEDGNIMAAIFCATEKVEDDPSTEEAEEPIYYTGKFNEFGFSFFNHFGEHNVAAAMLVNMGNVTDADIVSSQGTVKKLSDLTFQILFGLLMFMLFGFAYVALAVVLIARLIVLWISLALSPVVVLMFVFPDLANAAGSELDLKGQFFKHLFAPLIIGVVFSVGFTMLAVLQDSTSGSWMGELGKQKFSSFTQTEEIRELSSTYGDDISDFQNLLIAIGAVIIIWVGVFGAASQTLAQGITNTIKGAGESAGKFLATAPAYATAIPIPGKKGKTTSLLAALSMPKMLQGALQEKGREQSRALAKELGITPSTLHDKADETIKKMRGSDKPTAQQELNNYLKSKGVFDDKDKLREVLEEYEKKTHQEGLKEQLKKIDNKDLEKQLRTGDLRTLVFKDASGINPGEWDKTDLAKAETEEKAPKAMPVDEIQKALKDPRRTQFDQNNPELLTGVRMTLLKDPNASQLFTNPSDPKLQGALQAFKGFVSTDENAANAIISGTAVNGADGKLVTEDFVKKVNDKTQTQRQDLGENGDDEAGAKPVINGVPGDAMNTMSQMPSMPPPTGAPERPVASPAPSPAPNPPNPPNPKIPQVPQKTNP